MAKEKYRLELTDAAWVYGSYPRRDYKYNNLYTCFSYKDFTSFWNLNTNRYTITDGRMDAMENEGLISDAQRAEYDRQMVRFTEHIADYDDGPMEHIYGQVQKIRLQCAGGDALKNMQKLQMQSSKSEESFYHTGLGIDQRAKKDDLIGSCDAVIFALSQAELCALVKADLIKADEFGKQIYILTGAETGSDIPSRELWHQYLSNEPDLQGQILKYVTFLEAEDDNLGLNVSTVSCKDFSEQKRLQQLVDQRKVCLIVYGEDGLLHCRNLRIDAIVYADVSGFYTKAVTNQLADAHPCVVYIPPHFDITKQVKLIEKTTVSYWQLAQLWKSYGDGVYDCNERELYQKYPQFFLNVYESGDECLESREGYPIRIDWQDVSVQKDDSWLGTYYKLRDQAIRDYLSQNDNMDYLSTWFSEYMEEQEIPWGCQEQQRGILVHGIRMKQAEDSQVISCPAGVGLHQLVEQMREQDDCRDIQIFSNFLFFMTPRLAQMYNELRKDRPREQCAFHRDHLDFKVVHEDGKRVETFPLFRKACIAMKKNGQFLFFNFRLGGGRMKAAGQWISWSHADVDVIESNTQEQVAGMGFVPNEDQKMSANKIRIYTPYYSVPDESQSPVDYQKLVGKDRLNLVIMQDRILSIRMGEVMLSSVGVVVSLEKKAGEAFVKQAGLRPLEDGYYDCESLDFELKLDKPQELSQQDWDEIAWAYGGGLSLILDEKGVCDDGEPESCFREEGWMSPLSRQTQEAEIHRMVKHPRTAIGLTKGGSLVILVYSGRITLSSGADYGEMITIARKLFPDIQSLMNVDGGGSAMLGMSIGKSFMELSYPAISLDSCAGMVRPINTTLCLKLDRKHVT